ncbi:MAG TPA: NifB/NifX family molybdenum-iron cluster-binding protein [Bryobacteraceae bacterium]|nr:NifB/NifX family molybdenum-iron cluster-binding protein [Bryobacteraceae bacterium]HPT28499.1 NifB/NifX family molybdenum-iron cluster-binding protein [Bryobacteraceae bacterium]
MRIAVPVAGDLLSQHFGHSRRFALVDADLETRTITAVSGIDAPEHQPSLLPPWLEQQGVNVVIAGGMGSRAKMMFEALAVEVFTGAPEESPEALVRLYLDGQLVSREVICEH